MLDAGNNYQLLTILLSKLNKALSSRSLDCFDMEQTWRGALAVLRVQSWMRSLRSFSWECSENRKNWGSWRRLREQNNLHKPWSAGERNGNGKTQEDQYRQKLEDVFSGQEPIAKISEDVNSSALPVFKSAHDTESCQESIKKDGRAVV